MEEEYPLPHPDFTPEQKAAIYAQAKKNFTVEDLIGYIEDDEPVIPFEEVRAELAKKLEGWLKRREGAS